MITVDDCLAYIGKHIDKLKKADEATARYYSQLVLNEKVLPHVGTDKDSFRQKAYFIGYMVKKLLYGFLGKVDEDDRDHYGKKRLDMTGTLMIGLFKDQFKNSFIKIAEKIIRKKLHDKKTEM